jgi:molybdopterin/thiamine biosynthesis adenylyltransferase
MDLSRHISVFNPTAVKDDIHIIGVGATGSFVAMMLARMGVPVINIYDFDDVEIHNIPNQYYDTGDLGKLKAEALADKLRLINPDITVNVGKEAVKPEDVSNMSGYLFSLVDSMKVRKELWEAAKANTNLINVWESRLGSDQARVYSLPIEEGLNYARYEQDFYDDDNAEVSACGTSITVLPIVMMTASLMIVQFIDLVMENPVIPHFKTIFDNHYNKYEEDLETNGLGESEPEPVIEDIF